MRVLWTMAEARRRQQRIAMLPHMGGKFDRDRFLRTGFAAERKAYPLPDNPLLEAEIRRLQEEKMKRTPPAAEI